MANKAEQLANKINESRQIVKQIEEFGVSEDQKIDIIYFIAMTLNDNKALKEICEIVKKFKKGINNQSEENSINNSKIILE